MNTALLYQNATRGKPDSPPKSEEQSSNDGRLLKTQEHKQWLELNTTRELIKHLGDERQKLIDQAIVYACNYPNNDAMRVILYLVRANELQIIINNYGKL